MTLIASTGRGTRSSVTSRASRLARCRFWREEGHPRRRVPGVHQRACGRSRACGRRGHARTDRRRTAPRRLQRRRESAAFVSLGIRYIRYGLRQQRDGGSFRGLPALGKAVGVGTVQRGDVLDAERTQVHHPHAIGNGGAGKLLAQLLPTLVRFDGDEDARDVRQQRGVARLLPVLGAGNPQGWLVVVPEGVGIALAFGEHDVATLPRHGQSIQAVEADAGTLLPLETVPARPFFIATRKRTAASCPASFR